MHSSEEELEPEGDGGEQSVGGGNAFGSVSLSSLRLVTQC